MNTTTRPTSNSTSPINLGNGLVEISALTTLLGSETAGDLVLGNRGSSGLVWGSITTFGNSSVIKACAGAALPGWLRHMVGLRTKAADAAIGMDLPLSRSKFAQSIRSISLHGPLAISCESDGEDSSASKGSSRWSWRQSYKDVFAFDRSTSGTLEDLAAGSPGTPLPAYTVHPYHCFPFHNTRFHSIVLVLSLFKLLESYYLLTYGGFAMGLLSVIPFMFAFLAAVITEIHDIIASKKPLSTAGTLDLIIGGLPSTKQPGGPRKVVLGALKAPRTAILWRGFWVLNALLQTASLFIYYLLLGQEEVNIVITWAMFQVVWVALRTIIFNLSDTEPVTYRRMIKHNFEELSSPMKSRVLNLVAAVGTHQMYIHPRGIIVYKDDTFSTLQISKLLISSNACETYTLAEGISEGKSIQLNMIAIVGDTLLSAAAWMAGSEISPMDLYDSCLVVFIDWTRQPQQIVAIPAARVFSMSAVADSESAEPIFVPRGGGHNHYNTPDATLEWIYWIPCSNNRWIQLRSKQQTALGQVSGQVIEDTKLTKILSAGNLNISLKDAGDIKGVVNFSRKAANCLYSFLDTKSEA